MAIIKKKEMGEIDLGKKLSELRLELSKERANIAIGSATQNPGKIREIRKTISRILTKKNNIRDAGQLSAGERK